MPVCCSVQASRCQIQFCQTGTGSQWLGVVLGQMVEEDDGGRSPSEVTLWSRWQNLLFRNVDGSSLACFRIWFGFLMACEAALYHLPRAQTHYSAESFHFTYPGFSFVAPWPEGLMHVAIIVQAIAAIGVMTGIMYRVSATVLFLTYTHVFLIDEVNYNNHYYLFVLLTFFMIFCRADATWSIAKWLRPQSGDQPRVRDEVCPYWNVFILRAHLFIAYFYGGITKINGDWLRGEPMHKFLLNHASTPTALEMAETPAVVLGFAYGGLLFDLLVPVVLLFSRTRLWVIPLILGFNLTNHFLFTIGTFPWFMLGATLLFFPPNTPRKVVAYFRRRSPDSQNNSEVDAPIETNTTVTSAHSWVAAGLLVYLIVQVLLPFRHHFCEGYTDWTKLGQKFAWRMKSNSTDGVVRYLLVDSDGRYEILNPLHLNRKQAVHIGDEPRMIATYAKVLRTSLEAEGLRDFEIRCDAIASLNGRPYQYLIDPNVDISRVDTGPFGSKSWIVPLKPGQPVGNYALTAEERTQRITDVIARARQNSGEHAQGSKP